MMTDESAEFEQTKMETARRGASRVVGVVVTFGPGSHISTEEVGPELSCSRRTRVSLQLR